HRRAHVRYEGTDSALLLPYGTPEEIERSFELAYRQRFSFLMPDRTLLVEAVSVEAVGAGDVREEAHASGFQESEAPVAERAQLYVGGIWVDAPLVIREHTRAGHFIRGPAIVAEENATTVVEPGWIARVTAL